MQRNPLIAALVAAAFAFPLTAAAGGAGKHAHSTSASNDGGAEAMFKSLDKNNDGFISREEAKGSAHEADFAKLDKNSDGKLSRSEHANADAHLAAKSKDKAASAGDAQPATTASAGDTSAPKKY